LPVPDICIERSGGLTLFHNTRLESVLSELQVETVILTGVSTNIALFGTALEAVNRGYQVVLAEDCSAGATPESHRFQVEEQFPLLAAVTDSAAIIRELRNNFFSE
jgi:nicotinamidase-related amidase